MCFWQIPVYTSIWSIFRHIPPYTCIYVDIHVWSFLSRVSGFQMLWHMGLFFFYYFSFMIHYSSLFFILFSIMTGCQHPDNGTVQTAIIDPCTEEWLKSVHEEGQFTWIKWKARIQNGKQPAGAFLNYYTHYFYYYTDYFSRLTRIAAAVSMSFAQQIYVQRFCVSHQAKEISGKLPFRPKPRNCSAFVLFFFIISLLFKSFF